MDALPIESRPQMIMSAATLDGHAVTTHRFRSSLAPEAVAESLRARWRAEGTRFVEATRGEWLMLSTRHASAIETLQLRRTADGTEGLHSLWRREPSTSATRASTQPWEQIGERMRSWLPATARPVRQIAHRDGARQAATLVATADGNPGALAADMRRRMQHVGFRVDPMLASGDTPAGTAAATATGGRVIALRRGTEEVVATLATHRGESAIVMHWSQQP